MTKSSIQAVDLQTYRSGSGKLDGIYDLGYFAIGEILWCLDENGPLDMVW